MTALDDLPQNYNQLSNINFRFWLKRAPNLNWFCTKFNVPSVTLPDTGMPTPFVQIPFPGDHLEFEPLECTFKVDEDLNNWNEIHNWIRSIAHADNFDQYKTLSTNPEYTGKGVKSQIMAQILDSARNSNFTIYFNDAYPIRLSGLYFDHQSPDVSMIVANVTFRYTNFDYEKVIKS